MAPPGMLGLRIGTSAWTARRLLAQRGFRLESHESGPSYFGLVAEQTHVSVPRPYRLSVNQAAFVGPQGERLTLAFAQMPGGAALSNARLEMPAATSPDLLRTALIQLYGAPNCAGGWCFQPIGTRHNRASNIVPRLSISAAAPVATLDGGPQLQQLQSQLVAEAARDCRRSRLGVPLDNVIAFPFGC